MTLHGVRREEVASEGARARIQLLLPYRLCACLRCATPVWFPACLTDWLRHDWCLCWVSLLGGGTRT